jgi:plastocyanin
MKRGIKRIAPVLALVLATGLLALPTKAVASHAGALTVQVSNPIFVGNNCDPQTGQGCRFGESMRFLSPNLRVHQGDTITFDFQGFHTATLLPTDADWLDFRQTQTGGVGRPYSLVIPDPDDTAEEGAAADKPAVKLNPNAGFPNVGGTIAQCGAVDNPCTYDGSDVVNSGLPFGPGGFTVDVDASAGEDFWVMCLLHTHMVFKVTVVADDAATSTQADIDAAKASGIAIDQEWAENTDAKLLTKQSSHTTADGKKVYDVYAGAESHFANLDAFYPKKVNVPKGATVRYHFDDLVYEDHTVTGPTPGALDLLGEFFVPGCDPDGDTGPGPDGPPELPDPPFCTNPLALEFDISSRAAFATGDGTLSGANDLENSGVKGAQFGLTPYDVKFKGTSSKKGWKFFCLIHGPGMSNRVVVK